MDAGQDLCLTLTGRPGSGSPVLGSGSSSSLVIGLGVFGLALAWQAPGCIHGPDRELPVMSRRRPGTSRDSFESSETVMDAILALDDLYQAGELPEDAYRQRRAELKARFGVTSKSGE